MKKTFNLFALLVVLGLVFTVVACQSKTEGTKPTEKPTTTAEDKTTTKEDVTTTEKEVTTTVEDVTTTEETPTTTEHVHAWDEGEITTPPTCTEKGVKTFTCSCGETRTEEVDALGHNYEWVVDKEATVTETGSKHEECTRCHDKKSEGTVIPMLDHEHELTLTPAVAATCTTAGSKAYYTCSVCHKHFSDEAGQLEITDLEAYLPVEALGHTWNDGVVTTEATCTTEGVKTYTCTVCSETKTEAVATLNEHYYDALKTFKSFTPGSASVYEGSVETRTITIKAVPQSASQWARFEFAKPTENYKYAYVVLRGSAGINAGVKLDTSSTPGNNAYDSVNGNKQYKSLSDLTDTIYWDLEALNIPASNLEKIVFYAYSSTASTGTIEVLALGFSNTPDGHTYGEAEMLSQPTCTETGRVKYTCSLCGHTKEVSVAALGHSYENKSSEHRTWKECSVCHEMSDIVETLDIFDGVQCVRDLSAEIPAQLTVELDTNVATYANGKFTSVAPGETTVTLKNGETVVKTFKLVVVEHKEAKVEFTTVYIPDVHCYVYEFRPTDENYGESQYVVVNVKFKQEIPCLIFASNAAINWNTDDVQTVAITSNQYVEGFKRTPEATTNPLVYGTDYAIYEDGVLIDPTHGYTFNTTSQYKFVAKLDKTDGGKFCALMAQVKFGNAQSWDQGEQNLYNGNWAWTPDYLSLDFVPNNDIDTFNVYPNVVIETSTSLLPRFNRIDLKTVKDNLILNEEFTFECLVTGTGSVKWASSNESIATVDANGKVTALAIGNTTITASLYDAKGEFLGKASKELEVVAEPVPVITFEKEVYDLIVGSELTIVPTLENATFDQLQVVLDKDDVINFNLANGKVTGLKAGTVVATAKVKDVQVSITINVYDKENAIEFIPNTGASTNLKIQEFATNKGYELLGKTWIAVEFKLAKPGTHVVFFDSPRQVGTSTDTSLIGHSTELGTGLYRKPWAVSWNNGIDDSHGFGAGVADSSLMRIFANGVEVDYTQGVTWSTDVTYLVLYKLEAGACLNVCVQNNTTVGSSSMLWENNITYDNSLTVSKMIAVDSYLEVVEVLLDKNEATMKVGDELDLVVSKLDAEAAVTWTSSDEAVATVNNSGKVTALAMGTTTIKATLANGKEASCLVTVKPAGKSTVTFKVNGYDYKTVEVDNGNKVSTVELPALLNYTFDGWYDGAVEYDFDTPVTADLVLTAKNTLKADETNQNGLMVVPNEGAFFSGNELIAQAALGKQYFVIDFMFPGGFGGQDVIYLQVRAHHICLYNGGMYVISNWAEYNAAPNAVRVMDQEGNVLIDKIDAYGKGAQVGSIANPLEAGKWYKLVINMSFGGWDDTTLATPYQDGTYGDLFGSGVSIQPAGSLHLFYKNPGCRQEADILNTQLNSFESWLPGTFDQSVAGSDGYVAPSFVPQASYAGYNAVKFSITMKQNADIIAINEWNTTDTSKWPMAGNATYGTLIGVNAKYLAMKAGDSDLTSATNNMLRIYDVTTGEDLTGKEVSWTAGHTYNIIYMLPEGHSITLWVGTNALLSGDAYNQRNIQAVWNNPDYVKAYDKYFSFNEFYGVNVE